MRLPNERTFRLSNGVRLFVRSHRYGRNRVTLVVTRDSEDNVLGSRTRVRRGRDILTDMVRGAAFGKVGSIHRRRDIAKAREDAMLVARVTRVSTNVDRHFPIYILEYPHSKGGYEYVAQGGQELSKFPYATVVEII